MSVASSDVPYRLEELGWLQFQQLCDAVGEMLGVATGAWRGSADILRVALVDGEVTLPEALGGDRLAGPVTVIARFRPGRLSKGVAANLRRELRQPGRTVLLTNLDADQVSRRISGQAEPLVVAGRIELGRLLDAAPDLRLRLPSVLGVRDLTSLARSEAAERSAFDLRAAADLARVFVPTAAYAAACDTLRRHGFAVLLGPPEMGKTAIARMIGLAQLTRGWEVHECIRPEQVLEAFRRDRAQVFVADDAFGSTEYRPDAADRWALDLDRILRGMDERHWLLWTSRPAPLRAGLGRVHREHGVERFPQPAEVYVDAANLSVEEKALILFRHARRARLSPGAVDFLQVCGVQVVAHRHFTPERIRRFIDPGLRDGDVRAWDRPDMAEHVRQMIDAALREPTEAMAASLDALAPEHRALLVAMLDVPPGPVGQRDLGAAARRHAPEGLARPAGELLDRLTDHFLAASEDGQVGWVHPSWRDLVIDRLAAHRDARLRFLAACGLEGVLLALSTAGGPEGERRLPLLVEDADWDALTGNLEGLVPRLDDPAVQRLSGAVAEAAAAEDDPDRVGELQFVAIRVLERARQGAEALPPALGPLEAWFALAAQVPDRPAPPDLSGVWADLLPSDVDPSSIEDAARVDDWARLLEILTAHAPDVLLVLGHPESSRRALHKVLRRLEEAVEEDDPVPGAWDVYARALRSLWRTFPEEWASSRALASALRTEPRDVSSALRAQVEEHWVEADDPRTVERILRDLTPPGRSPFFRR